MNKTQVNQQTIRYINEKSEWVRSFACNHISVLIVCRGPIRKEAMDVFESLGIRYGILLSEKDSVTYPQTLAPEIRQIKDPERIHRIPDYTGVTQEERNQRIQDIIHICKEYNYTHVFAGYGFMAEDAHFVMSLENAGIGFIGPESNVHLKAGSKDNAKKIARSVNVSVTPGIDNITSLTLIDKVGGRQGLLSLIEKHHFEIPNIDQLNDEELAEEILNQSYKKSIPLITLEDLQKKAKEEIAKLLEKNPGKRIRLKHVGGGGGKGQRIVTSADQVPDAVLEVLSESKALGPSDNKNFLIEMNIENTRHNEIQLLGNGEWAISLGGRDCSIQMYEQKLVELSITDELYEYEIERLKKENKIDWAKRLEKDREFLRQMEEQAERFALAVGLNSASTFECIVSDDGFYFMEMNTRIQVEHRVTEMVYGLRFRNPDNPEEYFDVESLVEAMVLCAVHGKRLPKPERYLRNLAGGEIRLNAMNQALQPHAGGIIEYWSEPVEYELRDDQGIGIRNPDTNAFIHYHLAGAYDSNIALIVSWGNSRTQNLERLGDILRQMELRGSELSTNREFHMGMMYFLLGLDPMARPDTKVTVPYLALVGNLAYYSNQIDIDFAWEKMLKFYVDFYGNSIRNVLDYKLTLITRPIKILLKEPHLLSGWLRYNYLRNFDFDENQKVRWFKNPLFILDELYTYLHLEERDAPALQKIWSHDYELLQKGLDFYKDLYENYKDLPEKFYELHEYLIENFRTSEEKQEILSAHLGFILGLELLEILILIGKKSKIFDVYLDKEMHIVLPEEFYNVLKQKEYIKNLAPPPVASSDTIVAPMGGMIYFRETPDSPPYVNEGDHFEAGKPLFIIEVMKMFNKIPAEFSGTIVEKLVKQDGVVVRKGQPIFKVKPDEEIKVLTPEEIEKQKQLFTKEILDLIYKNTNE
ncbi:MAG: biotin carboxylase [Leptospiraceae bacterium]|nr:MAG: biotin carboxylase [Leptospiraceae bacterium]